MDSPLPILHLFFSIDGTPMTDKFIIYANDSDEKDANCKAKSFLCKGMSSRLPFIVTKRDILKGDELTYCYGNYEYEWRTVSSTFKD